MVVVTVLYEVGKISASVFESKGHLNAPQPKANHERREKKPSQEKVCSPFLYHPP